MCTSEELRNLRLKKTAFEEVHNNILTVYCTMLEDEMILACSTHSEDGK
jgi:hypothetical protein